MHSFVSAHAIRITAHLLNKIQRLGMEAEANYDYSESIMEPSKFVPQCPISSISRLCSIVG